MGGHGEVAKQISVQLIVSQRLFIFKTAPSAATHPDQPMPATTSNSGACFCGQVVFDLADRQTGDILRCSCCGRKFRFLGGEEIELLTAEETKRTVPRPQPKAQAQVQAPSSQTARLRDPRESQKRAEKPEGPPGGLVPMIGFIVAFNALAFIAFGFLLSKEDDGLRHAIWDHDFTISAQALWPDLTALALGHLFGFAAWAAYVYRLHKKQKAEAKA